MQTAEGKLYLFVGIDRTAKFAVTQLIETAAKKTAWGFLRHLLEALPYRVRAILTDRAIGTPLMVWMAPAPGVAMRHSGVFN